MQRGWRKYYLIVTGSCRRHPDFSINRTVKWTKGLRYGLLTSRITDLPTQLFYQFLSPCCDISRKLYCIYSFQNYVVRFHGVRAREWRCSSQQLKHEDSQ